MNPQRLSAFFALLVLSLASPPTEASVVRFHFTPADLSGTTVQKPNGMGGALGTRTSWFGLYREPFNYAVRPTHLVTFWHPFSGRYVTVPLAFPAGTPRIERLRNAIRFNYGSYAVDVDFLADGSVDTVYRNGFLRVG